MVRLSAKKLPLLRYKRGSEDNRCKGLENYFFSPLLGRKHKTDEEPGAVHSAAPAARLSDKNSEPGKKISRQQS